MTDPKTAILFAPEAEIVELHQLESAIGCLLGELDFSVRMVTCARNLLPLCPAMIAQNLSLDSAKSERFRTCERCEMVNERVRIQSGIPSLSLDDFLEASDDELAVALRSQVTRDNYSTFSFGGVPVGRYATYLPLLRYKVPAVTVDENIWDEYLAEVESIIRVIKASERLFDSEHPSIALTSNHLYGIHRAFLQVARNRGLSAWGLSAGMLMPRRTDSALLLPDEQATQTLALSDSVAWSRLRGVSALEMGLVEGHIHSLVEGADPWVYSSMSRGLSPSEIRSNLGLRQGSKVVTVLLSSPDETRATTEAGAEFRIGDRAGFLTTSTFLEHVIQAVQSLPEVDFVFRLHPRMFPNKRESVESPDVIELMERLEGLPANAHLCLPRDGISLYDNIAISDAAINFTSSSGLEFLLFGLPVVHLDGERLGAYPADLGTSVPTPDALQDVIRAAIDQGWDQDKMVEVVRWWATVLVRIAVFPLGVRAPEAASVTQVEPSEIPGQSIRRFAVKVLPESIKRRLSDRSLAKQRLNLQFSFPIPDAREELSQAFTGSAVNGIWNPRILLRGEPLEDEPTQVLTLVADILEILGWHNWDASERAHAGSILRLIETIEVAK